MQRSHRRVFALAGAITLALAATVAAAQPAPPGTPIATGLSNPRGLSAAGSDVIVAELGAGNIVRINADGESSVVVSGLPTTTYMSAETGAEEAAGPSSAIAVDGGYVITVSEGPDAELQSVYFATEGSSSPSLLVDLGQYERDNNTDGDTDLAGNPEFLSNPYSVIAFEDGFLISNSGANALLRIAPDGTVSPFAVFTNRENPLFPGLGGPTMDQVPTGVTIGPDGAVYVGTLTGFPFPSGGAVVYRVEDGNGDGDALDDGEVEVYADGLTTVTDVDFDGADLLVSEFSTNMLAQAPGRVVRISGGEQEVVASGLISPTSLLVTDDGRILVSQEFAGLVSDISDVDAGGEGTPTVPAPADTGLGGTSEAGDSMLAVLLAAGAATLVDVSRRTTARQR